VAARVSRLVEPVAPGLAELQRACTRQAAPKRRQSEQAEHSVLAEALKSFALAAMPGLPAGRCRHRTGRACCGKA
jgi:hypothetical protein